MQSGPEKDIRFARAEIDLSSLAHNIRIIKSYRSRPETKIMAVVKADAYGHGATMISREAIKSGVDALGVAFAPEGILLREEGINIPVYILGECPPFAVEDAIKNNLILTVNSLDSAKVYSEIAGKMNIRACININIDTGMNRLGINWRNITDIAAIKKFDNIDIDGIFTHFACASEEDPSYTMMQMKRFLKAEKLLTASGIPFNNVHSANSAAFFRFNETHLDMVRTGISIYGLNPYGKGWENWLPEKTKKIVSGLRPVLSFKSNVSFIKKLASGEPVSYCGTFRTSRDSIIATVPVGYGDGYSRLLSNGSKVLIKGMEAPVAGNITMDQFMVDITDISKRARIMPGDEVVMIGTSGGKIISAEDIAGIMGTINYEAVCMIGKRIPRIYIK
ncbi:MAG TPA: alanine racemase [Actinobacteria bacterium]|nr:alanine racemase [Actinomycetota bacterium]